MLFQPQCLLCHQMASKHLCPGCYETLRQLAIGEPRCRQCALPLDKQASFCGECLARPPAFERALIPYRYQYPLDYLIGRYKFSACLATEKLLTDLFARFIAAHASKPDLIVPTPLHWRGQFKRGYNQAQRLAAAAARVFRMSVSTNLLRKVRHTPAQHGLKLRERKRNLHRSFQCKPLQGQTVALVDDVVTTGTTARQLSGLLLRAGAGQVQLWALARTPKVRDRQDYWTGGGTGDVQ